MIEERKSTKACPFCGCTDLVLLRDSKLCPDCKQEFAWHLEPGQRRAVSSHRDKRADK